MSRFTTGLSVYLIDDVNDVWRLASPLIYMSDEVGEIVVPEGFTTDFASVPRIPLAFFLTGNMGRYAATVHDYLYTNHRFDRATADRIFLDALATTGIGWWVRQLMYAAVRIFGNGPYNAIHKEQR